MGKPTWFENINIALSPLGLFSSFYIQHIRKTYKSVLESTHISQYESQPHTLRSYRLNYYHRKLIAG